MDQKLKSLHQVKKASAKNFQLVVNAVVPSETPGKGASNNAECQRDLDMPRAVLQAEDPNTIYLMFGKVSKAVPHTICKADQTSFILM